MTALTPWLEEAAKITTGDRSRDYGRPLLNFLRIGLRWSNFLGVVINPMQVAMMMVDVKIAREQNTSKEDNWVDTLGYAACASDMNEHMKELGLGGMGWFTSSRTTADLQALYDRLMRERDEEQSPDIDLDGHCMTCGKNPCQCRTTKAAQTDCTCPVCTDRLQRLETDIFNYIKRGHMPMIDQIKAEFSDAPQGAVSKAIDRLRRADLIRSVPDNGGYVHFIAVEGL